MMSLAGAILKPLDENRLITFINYDVMTAKIKHFGHLGLIGRQRKHK